MKFVIILIITLALLLIAFCYGLFYMAIVRYRSSRTSDPEQLRPYLDEVNAGRDWFLSQKLEDIELVSHDGVRLVGELLPAEGKAKGTIIVFHGYRMGNYRDYSCVYKIYHDFGYNLLNVHQRAHGRSSGKYITFGVHERYDCLCWAQYVCDRFGKDHTTFLGGISMGAATVLMASGLDLPANVRGITADSAYTSPYDEFVHILKIRMHLPVHPFLDIAEFFAKIFANFSFNEASALEAVKQSKVPTLFISGEADDFVPHSFTLELYEACAAEKMLLTVPGAGHGMSYLTDKEKCLKVLREFFDKHTK